MIPYETILKARKQKFNDILARYGGKEFLSEYYDSLSEDEGYKCLAKNFLNYLQDKSKPSASKSKCSSKVKKPKYTYKRGNIGKVIPTYVQQNIKIENIESMDLISKNLIQLDMTKKHNFGYLRKVNTELKIKSEYKNNGSSCCKNSLHVMALNTTSSSMTSNKDKKVFNNLNIIKEEELTDFPDKSTPSIRQANISLYHNINASTICQVSSSLPLKEFSPNTDYEKLTTFRSTSKDITLATLGIKNVISKLHNTTYLKNQTNISKSLNIMVINDSSGESDEENSLPVMQIHSNSLPQKQINESLTNLKKDTTSTNSHIPSSPLVVKQSPVKDEYRAAKIQNKYDTNSDSDYDICEDIFPAKNTKLRKLTAL